MDVLNVLSNPLFTLPETMKDHESLYQALVKGKEFHTLLKLLRRDMSLWVEYVCRFAAVTTKRLASLRNKVRDCKTKRKKDVVLDNIISLLATRTDPYREFTEEVEKLDPSYENVLRSFAVLDDTDMLNSMESSCKLQKYLTEKLVKCYKPILSIKQPPHTYP